MLLKDLLKKQGKELPKRNTAISIHGVTPEYLKGCRDGENTMLERIANIEVGEVLEKLDSDNVWDIIEVQVDKNNRIRDTEQFLELLRECEIDIAICAKFGREKCQD